MPSFKDPALEQQKKELGAQIEQIEMQIESAPEGTDTSDLEQQLEQLEDQMHDVQQQRKKYRDEQRALWKAGKGQQP